MDKLICTLIFRIKFIKFFKPLSIFPRLEEDGGESLLSGLTIKMKLTTRGHYSVKALLDLSLQPKYGPASVKAIASRQEIPAAYLEKLLIEMRHAGLVHSLRGSIGGYKLARHPQQISIGEILEAVGENIADLAVKVSPSTQAEDWVTFTLWQRLNQKLREALYSITLADLYYDARSRQAAVGEEASFVV